MPPNYSRMRALQMGVSQGIANPIVIANFDRRIRMMLDSPRALVTSRDYAGPDRRISLDAPHSTEQRATIHSEGADDASN